MAIDLARARLRYMSALGVALPSIALVACRDPSPPTVAMTDGGASTTSTTPSATSTATTTATATVATATATATDTATTASSGVGPGFPGIGSLPSCPSGKFCTSEKAKVDPKDAAPAPYAKCSLSEKHPDDASDAGPRGMFRSVAFSAENTAAERAKTPNACCYNWFIPCPGGRAFRDGSGATTVARTIERRDWTLAVDAVDADALPADARAALAEHWTREAAFEHASIAAFAQLTLDLLGAGAPPELLAGAQRAALDEIEHARVAFALASAYGGRPIGPAPLGATPGPAASLAAIARTTFIDACVGESVASAALSDRAENTADPVVRELLATMAADEERHAELAWRIVAWALSAGGRDVARAVAAATSEVREELEALDALEAAGAATSETILRAAVLREIALPCAGVLLARAEARPRAPARARRRPPSGGAQRPA